MKKLSWNLASLSQLYEIAYYDRGCNPRYKIEAENEIRRRTEAKRANVKHRAMGRNYG
jgi:hypothetical protein